MLDSVKLRNVKFIYNKYAYLYLALYSVGGMPSFVRKNNVNALASSNPSL